MRVRAWLYVFMCVTKNIATVYDKIRGQPGVSIFAFSIVQDKVHLLFLLGILLSGFSVASVNLEGPNIWIESTYVYTAISVAQIISGLEN